MVIENTKTPSVPKVTRNKKQKKISETYMFCYNKKQTLLINLFVVLRNFNH